MFRCRTCVVGSGERARKDSFRRSRSGTASRCGIDDGWLALVTTHGTHRCSPSLPLPRRTRVTALLPGERLPTFLSVCRPAWDVTAYIRSRVSRVCMHVCLCVCVCVLVHAHDLSYRFFLLTVLLASESSSLSLSKPTLVRLAFARSLLRTFKPFFVPFSVFFFRSAKNLSLDRSFSFFFLFLPRGGLLLVSVNTRQTTRNSSTC